MRGFVGIGDPRAVDDELVEDDLLVVRRDRRVEAAGRSASSATPVVQPSGAKSPRSVTLVPVPRIRGSSSSRSGSAGSRAASGRRAGVEVVTAVRILRRRAAGERDDKRRRRRGAWASAHQGHASGGFAERLQRSSTIDTCVDGTRPAAIVIAIGDATCPRDLGCCSDRDHDAWGAPLAVRRDLTAVCVRDAAELAAAHGHGRASRGAPRGASSQGATRSASSRRCADAHKRADTVASPSRARAAGTRMLGHAARSRRRDHRRVVARDRRVWPSAQPRAAPVRGVPGRVTRHGPRRRARRRAAPPPSRRRRRPPRRRRRPRRRRPSRSRSRPQQIPSADGRFDHRAAATSSDGFRFGSYGRVIADTDLRGGKPEQILVVAHGPRIVEDSYLELELVVRLRHATAASSCARSSRSRSTAPVPRHRRVRRDSRRCATCTSRRRSRPRHRAVGRLADVPRRRHLPVRLLAARQPQHGRRRRATIARRAPDAGGGDALELAAHVGVNRARQPYQYQTIEVPNPAQGATTVTQLNRQRMIAQRDAARTSSTAGPASVSIEGASSTASSTASAVGHVPARRRTRSRRCPPTPATSSAPRSACSASRPVGSKLRRHLNLFTRYAQGSPRSTRSRRRRASAPISRRRKRERAVVRRVGQLGRRRVGNVMIGALSRRFIDASGDATRQPERRLGVRARRAPARARWRRDWFVGADISYQARFPDGLNPITLDAPRIRRCSQIAPMVVFSPMGPSALRSAADPARLSRRAPQRGRARPVRPRRSAPRARRGSTTSASQAEWWFNSSYR